MKFGLFKDWWRGDGIFISVGRWLFAFRFRWGFRIRRPYSKPGYLRIYFGPLEIERRTFEKTNHDHTTRVSNH